MEGQCTLDRSLGVLFQSTGVARLLLVQKIAVRGRATFVVRSKSCEVQSNQHCLSCCQHHEATRHSNSTLIVHQRRACSRPNVHRCIVPRLFRPLRRTKLGSHAHHSWCHFSSSDITDAEVNIPTHARHGAKSSVRVLAAGTEPRDQL